MGRDNSVGILEDPNFSSLKDKAQIKTSKPEVKVEASETKSNEISEIYTYKPSVFEFSDEHLFTNQLTIDFREPVILSDKWNEKIDLSEKIRGEFRYLTATADLEIGSERTNLIQGYVDKYLNHPDNDKYAKWRGKVRVAIANKCESPNAFAFPDGTIIINQSIINLTNSVDELMAVVGHEVGHLLNETVANEYKSKSTNEGIGWLQETAADSLSAHFLEKIDLNPTAAITLFTHLSEVDKNKREDLIHQSSLMRCVEIINGLKIHHYENSSKKRENLPDGFKKEFQSTNMGIINYSFKEIETLKEEQEKIKTDINSEIEKLKEQKYKLGDYQKYLSMEKDIQKKEDFLQTEKDRFASLIEQKNKTVSNGIDYLYPRDLINFFDQRKKIYDFINENNSIDFKIKDRLVREWTDLNYSEVDINLFLLELGDRNSTFNPFYSDLSSISNSIFQAEIIDKNNLLETACDQIFHEGNDGNYYESTLRSLVDLIDSVYNFSANNCSSSVPLIDQHIIKKTSTSNILPIWEQNDVALSQIIGQTSLFIGAKIPNVIEQDNGLKQFNKHNYSKEVSIHRSLQSILFNYLTVHYLSSPSLEHKALEDFFQTIKTAGFQPLEERLSLPGTLTNALKNRDDDFSILKNAYKNIFGQELLVEEKHKFSNLPSYSEAKSDIIRNNSNLDENDILKELFEKFSSHPDFTPEIKIKYIEAALEGVGEGFVNKRVEILRILVKKAVNKKDFDKINFDNEDKEIKKDLANLGLDSESLFHQAEEYSTQKILQDQIDIIAVNLSENENEMLRLLEAVMTDKQSQIESWDLKSTLAIILNGSIDHLNKSGLSSIFNEKYLMTSTDGNHILVQNITDLERFNRLPLIQNLKNKIPNQSFSNWSDFHSGLNNIFKEYSDLVVKGEERYFKGPSVSKDLFSDNLVEVIFWAPMRAELQRLLTEKTIQVSDYPKIRDLLENYFPISSQKNELIRAIDFNYLQNEVVPIKDKIEFFVKNEKNLGIDGAILIAEQITTLEMWNKFFKENKNLCGEYLSGEKEAVGGLAIDWLSTKFIGQKKDFIVQTVTNDSDIATLISTQLANEWLKTCNSDLKNKNTSALKSEVIKFDPSTNKFIVSKEGRKAFISYKDVIDELKNLPNEKKQAILIKALTDTDGLLLSPEGKTILQTRLTESLGLKTGFFYEALGAVIQNEDDKNNEHAGLIGATTASMLTPFLFRALSTESIEYKNILVEKKTDKTEISHQLNISQIKVNNWSSEKILSPILPEVSSADLSQILNSSTQDLCLFGQVYQSQPNSELSQEAQKSNQYYYVILDKLSQQIKSKTEQIDDNLTIEAPLALEALIRAGESSPVLNRVMQIIGQIIPIADPATAERVNQTQDSTKGMEKIRFWYNLQLRAEKNKDFKNFLEKDLASLDNYLGGGSLFTTYGATTKEGEKIVIKMLNPNAGYNVESFYNLSLTALEKMSQNPTSKKISRDIKFAKSLLSVAEEWCFNDINDQEYSQRDDKFRLIIDDFNQKSGTNIVEAPARKDHFADKSGAAHIKIEALQKGVTLNKFLGKTNTSSDEKQQQRDSVETLLKFFDHQFDFSPTNDGNFIFHSDPHLGNYIIDINPITKGMKLGVIDRSMYLVLNNSEVKAFRLLKNNRGKKFIDQLVNLCLEKNEKINNEEKSLLKKNIKKQLTTEWFRQISAGENNAISYLQTVLQEFASNPQEIKMPVKYWLMVRNITVMKNLKKKWLN